MVRFKEGFVHPTSCPTLWICSRSILSKSLSHHGEFFWQNNTQQPKLWGLNCCITKLGMVKKAPILQRSLRIQNQWSETGEIFTECTQIIGLSISGHKIEINAWFWKLRSCQLGTLFGTPCIGMTVTFETGLTGIEMTRTDLCHILSQQLRCQNTQNKILH